MRALTVFVFCLVLAGCDPEPEGQPIMRTEIGSGEELATKEIKSETQSACRSVTFEGTLLTHCIADPALHRITTALGPKDGSPYRSLANLAGSRGANAPTVSFAMNAGMYDDEGQPIGYYVEGGDRMKELNRSDGAGNFHLQPNGVFFGTGSKWEVRTADDFYSNVGDRPQFGTQSGPMLVIDGKIHPEITENGPSRYVRNAVGIDNAGRAHFVISEAPLSFGRLARFYRDELKTPNALFLDGNVSALWDPSTDRLDVGAPLGPLLVIETAADEAS